MGEEFQAQARPGFLNGEVQAVEKRLLGSVRNRISKSVTSHKTYPILKQTRSSQDIDL